MDQLTYPFLEFNDATVEVWKWISKFTFLFWWMRLFIHAEINKANTGLNYVQQDNRYTKLSQQRWKYDVLFVSLRDQFKLHAFQLCSNLMYHGSVQCRKNVVTYVYMVTCALMRLPWVTWFWNRRPCPIFTLSQMPLALRTRMSDQNMITLSTIQPLRFNFDSV